jgi:4-hydroxybenzoate polyprenyltransferase
VNAAKPNAKDGSATYTIVCLSVGIAGVLVNATCALFVTGENWLPLFIYASVAMIVVGYVPHLKSLRWSRVATIGMSASLLVYFGWIALFAMGSD